MAHRRFRIDRGILLALVTVLIGVSLLSVDWYFVERDYDMGRKADSLNDNARYWFTKYPIAVHAEIEQGLDRRFVLSCLNSTEAIFEDLFNYDFEGGNVSSIPFDNIDTYTYRSVQAYLANGDNVSMRVGAQRNGQVDLTVRFLSGASPDFVLGISNWGARMVFLVNSTPDFWTTLHVMLHEFCHTCGLPHNEGSAIMAPIIRTDYVNRDFEERTYESATQASLQKYLTYPSNFTIPGLAVLHRYETDSRTEYPAQGNPLKVERVVTGHTNATFYFDSGAVIWRELVVTRGTVVNMTNLGNPATSYYVRMDERRMDLDAYWSLWTRTEVQKLLGIYGGI